MRRMVLIVCIVVVALVGLPGQFKHADSAQGNGYFTLTLLNHEITTSHDMNGDEIFIVGTVVYLDHSGVEQVCTFQTDQLSNNKRSGTITINASNSHPCGSVPVSGDGVLVHLEVWDNDDWDPVVKEAVSGLSGEALEWGSGALLAMYGADPTSMEGTGEVWAYGVENLIGFFEQADRIYEVTLYYPAPATATSQSTVTTTVGCRAVGSWPFYSPQLFVESEGSRPGPQLADSRLPLVWKQQATTFRATFSPRPLAS
ncbi:MAG: hypothetical protein GYB65_09150 [Chloroflexi bacterium]|nr:hypothetical protein [Chloroflexota bacterium]